MKPTHRHLLGCLIAGAALLALGASAVEAPSAINYSGTLHDPLASGGAGGPMTGNRNLIFRLYDAPTGGALQWSRQFPVFLNAQGQFNVLLLDTGTTLTNSPTNSLAQAFKGAAPLHLSIEVVGQGGELPRAALSSVPFAFVANHAYNASTVLTANVATRGEVSAISTNGTNGGFVVQSTGTNIAIRLDATHIESSGDLLINARTSNSVEIIGNLKIGGGMLTNFIDYGGSVPQASGSTINGAFTNVPTADGFYHIKVRATDLRVEVGNPITRTFRIEAGDEVDQSSNPTEAQATTMIPARKGERHIFTETRRNDGSGSFSPNTKVQFTGIRKP